MQRGLEPPLLRDLAGKTVVLTGALQVGKTTLVRQLMERFERAQYLNWDVPVDRAVLLRQSWNPATLLVLDEIHKMPAWKSWLKGVIDVVIVVQSWHRNIARALLQAPKVYFTDTGLVKGHDGVRFENAVAVMLAKQAHFLSDTRGLEAGLHYIRTSRGSTAAGTP